MVTIAFDKRFEKQIKRIHDQTIKARVKKQLEKLVQNPTIGKPMRYTRKGTRELRIPPFRLSYSYDKEHDIIILLELYHKDEQ